MPLRWQILINILPQFNWNITAAATSDIVKYSPNYVDSRLIPILKADVRFCEALEAKKAEILARNEVDKDEEAKMFSTLRDEARSEKQLSAAVRAQEQRCRLFGLFDEDNRQKAAGTLAAALGTMIRGNLFQCKPVDSTTKDSLTKSKTVLLGDGEEDQPEQPAILDEK